MKRTGIYALVIVAMLILGPPAAADHDTSAPIVSYTLTATAGANGWFKTNVTINWSVTDPEGLISAPCQVAQLVTTEGTTTHACTATSHGGTASGQVTLKIDKTAPVVSGANPARGPDANGWYNHPVAVAFTGTDAVSGLASCSAPTYAGGDGAGVAVSGTCTDVAGNTSAPGGFSLNYDATAPSVAAAPDRPPDGNGWYRKPLTVTFNGADATSGVESCTQPARYAGPDKAQVAIAGTCRDRAGNTAAGGLTTKYDATAPKLAGVVVQVEAEKRVARVRWKKPSDAVLVLIDRTPGVNGRKKTRVYKGTGQSFVDRTVRKGVRYRYEVLAADAAGNVAGRAVTATARPTLYAPLAGARVRAPVRLAWKPFKGARFYNVQLFRGKTKVLSLWPTTARLRLPKAWRYLGKKQTLRTGRYTWFVWPALGTRAKPRYGRPLGSSTFTVRRR